MSTSNQTVVVPVYIDEAEARGFVRDLQVARDDEFGLMCAVVFDPEGHERAIEAFKPAFERFRDAAPPGAKLHITDAFKRGNEAWRPVAEEVRKEYLHLIGIIRPMIVYSARRLRLARETHVRQEASIKAAKAAKRSSVKIVGENRPSDARIEDDLIMSLTLRLDAFAEDMAKQIYAVKHLNLIFDQVDREIADRYEAIIQRTREVSTTLHKVKGWDPTVGKRVEGAIAFNVEAPFRIDTKFIGPIQVVGKDHPLVLAADIVANHLAHHLRQLSAQSPLNAPSSIAGWVLEDRVWGVQENATDDMF